MRGVARLCQRPRIPLLVGEEWRRTLPFHPTTPTAVQAGAGIVVQSLHKAGVGLCQASVTLTSGTLADPDLLLRLG